MSDLNKVSELKTYIVGNEISSRSGASLKVVEGGVEFQSTPDSAPVFLAKIPINYDELVDTMEELGKITDGDDNIEVCAWQKKLGSHVSLEEWED